MFVCGSSVLLLNVHSDSLCDLLEVPHGISVTCYLFICFHDFLDLEKETIHNEDAAETAVSLVHVGAMCYLHIDEIVERVNVLLHKPFHLGNK